MERLIDKCLAKTLTTDTTTTAASEVVPSIISTRKASSTSTSNPNLWPTEFYRMNQGPWHCPAIGIEPPENTTALDRHESGVGIEPQLGTRHFMIFQEGNLLLRVGFDVYKVHIETLVSALPVLKELIEDAAVKLQNDPDRSVNRMMAIELPILQQKPMSVLLPLIHRGNFAELGLLPFINRDNLAKFNPGVYETLQLVLSSLTYNGSEKNPFPSQIAQRLADKWQYFESDDHALWDYVLSAMYLRRQDVFERLTRLLVQRFIDSSLSEMRLERWDVNPVPQEIVSKVYRALEEYWRTVRQLKRLESPPAENQEMVQQLQKEELSGDALILDVWVPGLCLKCLDAGDGSVIHRRECPCTYWKVHDVDSPAIGIADSGVED